MSCLIFNHLASSYEINILIFDFARCINQSCLTEFLLDYARSMIYLNYKLHAIQYINN